MLEKVTLVIIAVLVYLIYKGRETIANSDYESMSTDEWRVESNGEVIISVPNIQTNDSMVVIGGMYQSNPIWMYDQLPEDIKRTKNIVIGPYTQSVERTIGDGTRMLNGFNRMPVYTSLSGFSAGGARVSEYYRPNQFDLVMFIDPALSMENAMKDFGAECILLYGSDPMEDLYTPEYEVMAKTIEENGGVVEEIETGHYTYPQYSFLKYQFSL